MELKHIKNYENKYAINIHGQVFSFKSKRFLKPTYDSHGYLVVCLVNAKKSDYRNYQRIHRLIAEYFLPNYFNKPLVNHKNMKRDDNRIENLEWVTNSENIRHGRFLRMKMKKEKLKELSVSALNLR